MQPQVLRHSHNAVCHLQGVAEQWERGVTHVWTEDGGHTEGMDQEHAEASKAVERHPESSLGSKEELLARA